MKTYKLLSTWMNHAQLDTRGAIVIREMFTSRRWTVNGHGW